MPAMRALRIMLAMGAMAEPVAAQGPSPALAQRRSPVDALVASFYEQRQRRLAWSDSGIVSREAAVLLRALAGAGDEGLDPQTYPTAAIDSLLRDGIPPDGVWRLDSLLTLGFFEYGSEVSHGRIPPVAVDSLWRATPHTSDLVRLLERGIDSGRVAAVLRSLPPRQPGYVGLRRGLARYRAMAARGGWRVVPAGPPLQPGSRSPRVAVLRRRLTAEGYTAPADSAAERVDSGLQAAIREFQDRHGLTADGIVGVATRNALNVSAAARLQQITVNLERWRWLPRALGDRYIVVNSAAFTLEVVNGAHPVLTMRAIVGRPDWPTPLTSSRVREAVFRPLWHVPRAIATRELLPLMQRDPGYLAREGMRVFGDSATGGREVDPATIDWSAVTESTFAYQLVQEPGPDNPLGGVKLVFWTPFDVFIHDTPMRPLFGERLRAFSHGCIRVEAAAELATYLLPDWSADSIHAAMTVGRERRVRLGASIPVHLVYFTAWSDADGQVEFRDDAYGWDERLAAALAASPPLRATGPQLAGSPQAGLPQAPRRIGCGP
jgi:murein L,D-transpeptidase YcbB/YkuD